MDVEDKEEMLTILKTLVREGHLSDEQFDNLRHTLQSLLTELKESGSTLTASMEELSHRNAIRVGEYENLKELTV